ncbi:MAG: hypothetical protein ACE37L_13400 [Allomuricauda sp.]
MQKLIRLSTFTALIYFVVTIGCTSEPDVFEYTIITKNSSNSSLVFELYVDDNLFESILVAPSSSYRCSYSSEFFRGFSGCNNSLTRSVDSIIFKFNNGKGYICSARNLIGANMECFPNKKLFRSDDETFQMMDNNKFLFDITQEDYENAFELP